MSTNVHITQWQHPPATIRSDADAGQAGIDNTNWYWAFIDNPKANAFFNMPNFSLDTGTGAQTDLDGTYNQFTCKDTSVGLLNAKWLKHLSDEDTYIEFNDDNDRIRVYAGAIEFMDLVEGATDYIMFFADFVKIDYTHFRFTIGDTDNGESLFSVVAYGSCTDTNMELSSYSSSNSYCGILNFKKSASASQGVLAETANTEVLGKLLFQGVGTGSTRVWGASLNVEQVDNASATNVPTEFVFYTSDSDSTNESIRIQHNGLIKASNESGNYCTFGVDDSGNLMNTYEGSTRFILYNTAESDGANSRVSSIKFRGQTAAETVHTLAYMSVYHPEAGSGQEGLIVFAINDGDDNDTLGGALMINSHKQLVIGTYSGSYNEQYADLSLKGSYPALALKESNTPTPTANYGKVYTKSVNYLFFQDGGGTEHKLMQDGTVIDGGSTTDSTFTIDNYCDTATNTSKLIFRKSDSDTIGTLNATEADDVLGRTEYYGVDTTPQFELSAITQVKQTSTAGGDVQSKYEFYFWNGSGYVNTMFINNAYVGITGYQSTSAYLNVYNQNSTSNIASQLHGNGYLMLMEITTPSATANYGKFYTKTNNYFYGQDGAGVEHQFMYDNEIIDGGSCTDTNLDVYNYSESNGHGSKLRLFASDSNTIGTKAQTDDDDLLGDIQWWGVNTGSDFGLGAYLRVMQNGTAGASLIPTDMQFFVSNGSAVNQALTIFKDGVVSIEKNFEESWGSLFSVLQLGSTFSFINETSEAAGNGGYWINNAYWDGSNWRVIKDDESSMIEMRDGIIYFNSAYSPGSDNGTFSYSCVAQIDLNGIYCGSDGAYNCGKSDGRWNYVYAVNGTIQTSDKRKKKDIEDDTLGLDFVKALRPIKYKRAEINSNDKFYHGLSAQDVETLIDSDDFAGIVYDSNTDVYGLNYSEFIAPLIKAVQQLSAEIEDLKRIKA